MSMRSRARIEVKARSQAVVGHVFHLDEIGLRWKIDEVLLTLREAWKGPPAPAAPPRTPGSLWAFNTNTVATAESAAQR